MKRNTKKPVNKERGSALFIILIAVVLFAALSYTVAQIMRSGDPETISEQKAGLLADEILNYARSLRQTVQSLQINGCDALDVSFSNSIVTGYAHTPTVNDSCKVFNNAGGGMVYLKPSAQWLDADSSAEPLYGEWYFPANVCVPDIGTGSTGCDSNGNDDEDLIIIVPYLREQVCIEINKKLNLGAAALSETNNAWPSANTKFTGTLTDGESIDQAGRMNGCFQGDGANTPATGTYHFYQVLKAR